MRINNANNSINFCSGLNQYAVKSCLNANISQIKTDLLNRNIRSDFKTCKPTAFLTQSAVNILETFKKKTNAKLFNFSIPCIFAYSANELNFEFKGQNFCIPETKKVLKNQGALETGSVLYECLDDIELLNNRLDLSYAKNERSSSHYLSPFIHEIMHNVYLNYIYLTHGYEGSCNYTKQKYFSKDKTNDGLKILYDIQTKTFNQQENKIIEQNVGKYATTKFNQYHELFAETFTKLICDSISDNGTPNKNPIDLLKKLPQDFLFILQKIFV